MKKLLILTAFTGLFSIAVLGGCSKEHTNTPAPKNVEVVITGSLNDISGTKSQIIPDADGLPDEQLTVGIVTVNYRTDDPADNQPGITAWRSTTADITRGYFGGPGLNASPVENGEIQYTNEEGTAIQKVFYDETGEHYFMRVYYPYEEDEEFTQFIQTEGGAAVVFEMDGQKDIMCSNLGWGNVYNPRVVTSAEGAPMVFSHMLSLFRIKVKAENARAAEQYGKITGAMMYQQPKYTIVDMMNRGIRPYTDEKENYYAVDFEELPGLTTDEQDVGYIMAMPGQEFIIAAKSEKRRWLSAILNFSTDEDPFRTSAPGTMYDVTLKFMESYQVHLEVEEAKEWWMDSEFD